MKLYCVKVYTLDRFNINTETYWSMSETVAISFLEHIMSDDVNFRLITDEPKYNISYFETEDDELIQNLMNDALNHIRIYPNADNTRAIVLTASQYRNAIGASSILNDSKDVVIERIHSASVRVAMIMLRYSKGVDYLDYIYKLVKHDFSNIKVDPVEYILNTKPWLKKYEL